MEFSKKKLLMFALTMTFLFSLSPQLSMAQKSDQTKTFEKNNIVSMVPAGWESVQTDTQVILHPKNLEPGSTLSIGLTNYDSFVTNGFCIEQKCAYEETQDLNKWLERLQQGAALTGNPLTKIEDLKSGVIFSQTIGDNYLGVVAFMIKAGHPMSVSIVGTGKYADLQGLKSHGTYEAFKRIVKSLNVLSDTFTPTELSVQTTEPIGIMSTSRSRTSYFTTNSDVSITQSVVFSASYQCAGCYLDEQFNNSAWYRYADIRPYTLYNAALVDNPTRCDQLDPGIVRADHPINKQTSSTTKTVSDNWSPNTVVSGANTVVLTKFGDLSVFYCALDWKPFY